MPAAPLPPAPPTPGPAPVVPGAQNTGAATQQAPLTIVVPTAINIVLLAAQNITQNLRVRQSADIGLPSLYKRAYLVAYTSDEIAVIKG